VDVGEGDAAFLPSSLDAFEKAYNELARQGITTRAVVGTYLLDMSYNIDQ